MSERLFASAIEILLVEDNPGDVRLIVESFKENNLKCHIQVVQDGEEALTYLCRKGKYKKAVRPHLVLLDLNLPKKNGHEVLAEIKTNPELRRIPVIILTSSDRDEDLKKSYDLYANGYISKPASVEELSRMVLALHGYWSSIMQISKE
jgi:two-component system, chemotaxis family, response regulator Rcp1